VQVRPGQEYFVPHIHVGLGGALNTASVASALGLDVCLAFPSGCGLTDVATANSLTGLPVRPLTWDAPADPAISLVVRMGGDRAFVSAAEFDCFENCPPLPSCSWIHVPGLHEANALSDRLDAARANGSRISVAGSWAPAELEKLNTRRHPHWDLLVLNSDEAAIAAGSEGEIQRLFGAAREIVVTNGAEGAHIYSSGRIDHVPSPVTTVVDSTGAGDAFCAGLLAGLQRGRVLSDAVTVGARAASRILGQHGGVASDSSLFRDLLPEL
jgi:sugar/nucleoside kinase (ribokinase family)